MTTYEHLLKQATYALKSHSRDLVYEAFGAAKMARNLGAITSEQMKTLNDMLVRHGLNDLANCKLD